MPLVYRLTKEEKESIISGDVFCWNEEDTRMKRWSDCWDWSSSRQGGHFLEYSQVMKDDKSSHPLPGGLIRRAIKIWCLEKTWHVVCFYAEEDLEFERLSVPSQNPLLKTLDIPPHKIHTNLSKRRQKSHGSDDTIESSSVIECVDHALDYSELFTLYPQDYLND
ncbi:hypothetical protein EDD86DRAFT_20411 [Gorgonomyces haynaldii]|nr:hypothetical protein EDD86DRAFT_20411 [Gorgonomyces haynaldii]